jgi:Secretion system C-terminal sorting domain
MTIVPVPSPVVTFSGGRLSTGTTYAGYQWYLGAAPISGATTYSYRPTSNGSYTVKVMDGNGCTGSSNLIGVTTTAVQEISLEDIKIYPNPATSVVHIECSADVRAVITSMEGRMIIDQTGIKDIDVSRLPAGMYIVMLYGNNDERLMVQKLIKE